MTTQAISLRNPLSIVASLGREIRDGVQIARQHGFRELVRQKGKRVIFAVIVYYFIRDSVLYLLIPYCVAEGIF